MYLDINCTYCDDKKVIRLTVKMGRRCICCGYIIAHSSAVLYWSIGVGVDENNNSD